MEEQNNLKECVRCGYKWESRVEDPKECPECKSRYWKVRDE